LTVLISRRKANLRAVKLLGASASKALCAISASRSAMRFEIAEKIDI
jgi:hypothetical protein